MSTAQAGNVSVIMSRMKGLVTVNKLTAGSGGVRLLVAIKGPAVTRPTRSEKAVGPANAWLAFAQAKAKAATV